MSADLLRQAATILRERAGFAAAGPWDFYRPHFMSGEQSITGGEGRTDVLANGATEQDAAYIATMHPGVGLGLADWLDAEAERQSGPFAHPFGPDEHAIAVASLIVGGDA